MLEVYDQGVKVSSSLIAGGVEFRGVGGLGFGVLELSIWSWGVLAARRQKECLLKREFKLPWREAGSPNHHDDIVDSDQQVVNKELSLSLPTELSNATPVSGCER